MKKLILGFILFLAGCGGIKVSDDGSGLVRECNGADCAVGTASKSGQVAGVARQRQVFNGFQSCLKLPDSSVSAATKGTFAKLSSNLSVEGKITDINGPMFLTLAQLAGDFCQDRITYEANLTSGEKLFTGFSLKAGTSNDFNNPIYANALGDAVNNLAKSCWGRKPSSQEIVEIRNQYANSQMSQVRNASGALFLCTLVLSSPAVIVF